MIKKVAKNIKETSEVAKLFLDEILNARKTRTGALVVCLSGDLGAGKTAFTKAIGKHLKIKQIINSPTFVIIKNYELQAINYKKLFHIDAYRLKNEKELLHLGWEEIVGDKKHLVFIEWPENVAKIIPKGAKFLYITADKKGYRNFELK